MLKLLKNNISLHKVINFLMLSSAIVGFIIPLMLFKSTSTTSLTSLAGTLRFLIGDRKHMMLDLTIHNLAIALLGFTLSFLTNGILGCLFLFLNFFFVGASLLGILNLEIIVFVTLESVGLFISTFYGTRLARMKKSKEISAIDIVKKTAIMSIVLFFIYFLASVIESNLILNKLR